MFYTLRPRHPLCSPSTPWISHSVHVSSTYTGSQTALYQRGGGGGLNTLQLHTSKTGDRWERTPQHLFPFREGSHSNCAGFFTERNKKWRREKIILAKLLLIYYLDQTKNNNSLFSPQGHVSKSCAVCCVPWLQDTVHCMRPKEYKE